MGQKPNRTPSEHREHPNPNTEIDSKMGAPTPKWYQNGFDNHSHVERTPTSLSSQLHPCAPALRSLKAALVVEIQPACHAKAMRGRHNSLDPSRNSYHLNTQRIKQLEEVVKPNDKKPTRKHQANPENHRNPSDVCSKMAGFKAGRKRRCVCVCVCENRPYKQRSSYS